ncbi:mediator of RNA polymerase II transcription subunit 20-like isoform X2 [Antedon mediterranea]|uniref:mediator of RNA polymerase II transcription subunit 20-like isoform X2 n=1 Tax=Antedon mediterranea TaxID=105859 RepID=UPI003AF6EA14
MMGVTCISQWVIAENRNIQQVVENVNKRLDLLGANKTGIFCVDCETYQAIAQTQGQSKVIHSIHNTEFPLSAFAVTDSGTCLVCDTNFDGIMQKLKGFYGQRKLPKIESKGQRFELGDFIIKVGIVSVGSHTKGLLVEVEYTPCVIISDCWNLMTEFMQCFMGNMTPQLPTILTAKRDANYTPSDTIMQYFEHFNNFRKAQVVR